MSKANGKLIHSDGKLRPRRLVPGALFYPDTIPADAKYHCCTKAPGPNCTPCTPTNANVASGLCEPLTRTQAEASCCTWEAGVCADFIWQSAGTSVITDNNQVIGDTVIPVWDASPVIVGMKLVYGSSEVTVTAVDYDNDVVTVTPLPEDIGDESDMSLAPGVKQIGWYDRTSSNLICWNVIDWSPYPDADWHKNTKGRCLRLLVWCPATHDGSVYDIGAPDYVYRLAGGGTAYAGGLPLERDCCSGVGIDTGFVKTDASDIEACAIPSAANMFAYLIGSGGCDDVLPAANEEHMIWAVVETFWAVRRAKSSGYNIWMGLSHAKVLSAGYAVQECRCSEPFPCE